MTIVVKTLKEAKEAAWRGVFRGLRSQGWKQAMSLGGCAMRGSGGRACAVGWLVRGESGRLNEYSSLASLLACGAGKMCPPLQEWYDRAGVAARDRFLCFTSDLQTIHDRYDTPLVMEAQFRRIGKRMGWKEPS